MTSSHRHIPAIRNVIVQAEKAWARDDKQAEIRADIVLRALVDFGLLPDAEIWHGLVVAKSDD